MRSVCVYCSAAQDLAEIYRKAAEDLGTAIAQAGFRLVYGGGRNGLMGVVADAAIKEGGRVLGFIPYHLEDREGGGHTGISELHVVDTMHVRKQRMAENSDLFVVLPGGYGTLDEMFEIMTWKQINIHNKPIILLNINNYWDDLIRHMKRTVAENFAKPEHKDLVIVLDSVEQVIPKIQELENDLYFDNDIT